VSQTSKRGAVCYEAESSSILGEDITTFSTFRVPIVGKVDCSGLKEEKIDSDKVTQRRQEGSQWIRTTVGGSFKLKFSLPGHGSSTAGAGLALSARETLLGRVLGNVALSAAAGTTYTGGTATVPTTTASGTFSAGSLVASGVLGDGRGNGQIHAIATHVGASMTLLTGLGAAPSNGDLARAPTVLYPSESFGSTAIQGTRFLLQTANLQYECHGCVCTGWEITGQNDGEVLHVDTTWEVAWWRYSTATFPSAVASDTFVPAACAAGSLFVADVGTATRASNTRTCRDFKLDWKLGVQLLYGPGGFHPQQKLIGAVRTIDEIKVSWTEDADSATTTPVLPGYGTGTNFKHLLRTWNTTDGKQMAFYAPNFCITNVPVQFDDNGINRLRVEGMCYTGTTTTNDLTMSAGRLAFA